MLRWGRGCAWCSWCLCPWISAGCCGCAEDCWGWSCEHVLTFTLSPLQCQPGSLERFAKGKTARHCRRKRSFIHFFTYPLASRTFNPCACSARALFPSFQGAVGFFCLLFFFFLVGLISCWGFLDDVIALEGGSAESWAHCGCHLLVPGSPALLSSGGEGWWHQTAENSLSAGLPSPPSTAAVGCELPAESRR